MELENSFVRSCRRSYLYYTAAAAAERVVGRAFADVAGIAEPGAAADIADMRFDRCNNHLLHHSPA